MTVWRCRNCGAPYPAESVPYRCPQCGGTFDRARPLEYDPRRIDPRRPGLWRFAPLWAWDEEVEPVFLGEGDTPLIWGTAFGRRVGFKLEYLNPTGSHKDRGTAPLVAWLRARGVREAVEDSSGNAGASFAAYAARAGIRARVFVPAYASGPKRAQIAAYGAEVVPVEGPRSKAAEAVRRAADAGAVYASHAHLPMGLDGFATIAWELAEQMDEPPGTIVAPVGQGSLLLGIARGADALVRAGVWPQMPLMVGVQALACAPLWAVTKGGREALMWVTEGETVAEGVRILRPVWGDALLAFLSDRPGAFVAVEEKAILPGRVALARQGFYVEPTSAIVWDALRQLASWAPDPIIAVLTGSGFKSPLSPLSPHGEGA